LELRISEDKNFLIFYFFNLLISMELTIDKNNILCIENENIPKTKEYFYNV
jgi:hypothetical protein